MVDVHHLAAAASPADTRLAVSREAAIPVAASQVADIRSAVAAAAGADAAEVE